MFRALIASFCFSFLLLLTACGGDSSSAAGGTPAAGSSTVSSVVVKGLIRNGKVTLSRWQNGAYVTVASTLTKEDGSFSLNAIGALPGEVLKLSLGLSGNPALPTEMLCDAEHCGSRNFGEWVPLTTTLALTSWATTGVDGQVTVMPVTPVSTLLVALGEALGGGHLTAESLTVARSRTAALFRLSTDELLAVPGNVADAPWLASAIDTTPAAAKIALLAAAFAQLSGGDVTAVNGVIHDYAQDFVDNNGRLMEINPGVGRSLATLYQGVSTTVDLITSESGQDWVNNWISAVTAELAVSKLSPICHETSTCEQFNSNRFVNALGTESGTLGYDLRQVMQAQGASTLEQMLAAELGKMGWLVSADTVALVGVAVQTIKYSGFAMANLALGGELGGTEIFPLAPSNGLTASADYVHKTVHVTGLQNGLNVDLTVTVPSLIAAMEGNKQFNFNLVGTVGNQRVSGEIDAAITVNAADTNFSAVLSAYQGLLFSVLTNPDVEPDLQPLLAAMGGLLKTAKASVGISASKARLVKGDSMLAIEGAGTVSFDLAGGEDEYVGGITLEGGIQHGTITLPNGSSFTIDPDEDHELTFTMGVDGSFEADFAASVLTAITGEASGTLSNMGPLVSGVRDLLAQVLIQDTEVDGNALVLGLFASLENLGLTVDAEITLTEFDHLYKLSIRDTTLQVTHPDSEDVALTVTLSLSGLLVTAGDAWWQLGVDLENINLPALVLADDEGGLWRWEFNLGRLLALQ